MQETFCFEDIETFNHLHTTLCRILKLQENNCLVMFADIRY